MYSNNVICLIISLMGLQLLLYPKYWSQQLWLQLHSNAYFLDYDRTILKLTEEINNENPWQEIAFIPDDLNSRFSGRMILSKSARLSSNLLNAPLSLTVTKFERRVQKQQAPNMMYGDWIIESEQLLSWDLHFISNL